MHSVTYGKVMCHNVAYTGIRIMHDIMECEFDIKFKCASTRYMYMYIYTYIDHLSKEVC